MNKLKGSIGAVKMHYLVFVFAVALLAALPTRVYQLIALVDPNNGFFNGSDVTIPVLYGALFIFALLFMALSFVSKDVPSPKLPVGKNIFLGIASGIMVLGLGWDILTIERKIVPKIEEGFDFARFQSLLTSRIEDNGGIFVVLQFVFALFAIFYFLIFAISHLNGKASYKEYKLLALSPVCWAITNLITRLMTAVSFIRVSELLFEIFMLVFGMLFFLTFARISTGVFTEDSMWGIYGYGFSAALFAGLVTIPRIVCVIVDVAPVEGFEFNFAHLAVMIFIILYIVSSLGWGFDYNYSFVKTVSSVDLPEDDDVVIKKSSRQVSYVETVSEPEIIEDEIIEEPEIVEDEVIAEPEIVEDEVIAEPEIVEDEVIAEPEIVEDEVIAEPEIVEDEVIAEPEIVEDEVIAEPEIVEDEVIAEPEIVEDEVIAEPEVIEDEVIAEPEIVEDEVIAEPEVIEDEIIEGFEIVEEPVVKDVAVPKQTQPKKEKKSLFGLRKAPVQEEDTEDLKPISLADLKKMQK